MEKLKMHSLNKVDKNIEAIGTMFPNCLTERMGKRGEVEMAIDFDVLRQELSSVVVDGAQERYQFTWPDKRKSILVANAPIAKTLRPCREESKDFDTTENLYIEGDNLDVLKLLQETYLGKVKMIYIDPPYNTGKDFVYEDDFAMDSDEWSMISGDYEDGSRLVKNLDSNGRFHTDWLNMIYPRLKVARDLLTDDGVIFISIDDNEVENLKKICDEVFGANNFVASIVWQKKYAATNDSKGFSTTHDYILVYQKSCNFNRNLLPRTEEQNKPYKNDDNDGKGLWRSDNLLVKSFSQSGVYPIINPNTGKEYYPSEGNCWRASFDTMLVWLYENRIYFGKDGKGAPQLKRYLNEVQQGRVPITWWAFEEVGHNDAANKEVAALFKRKTPFDTPKPVSLLKQILLIATNKNDIILDFFSGSATTAHAVIQLNAEDGGNRKFIMVQLPEETDEKSEARKAGYKNICEIGKERIRRAGDTISQPIQSEIDSLYSRIDKMAKAKPSATVQLFPLAQQKEIFIKAFKESAQPLKDKADMLSYKLLKLDTGFRVLKLDSTNMKDVYYNPQDYSTELFAALESNIKEDRTPEDLLFQVMLDLGVLLSAKIEQSEIAGKKVFNVNDGYLIACFDSDVTEETVTAIAKLQPYYFAMRDSSMATDSVATNFEQIFETYSKDTIRKIL